MQTVHPCIDVRDLRIDPPLLLAPMEGLTHSPFRRIVAGFGAVGLFSTEMLSAKRLPTESPTVSPYLIRTAAERPLSYQLLFSTIQELAPAIEALHKLAPDAIDLNMGCPAPAVRKFGAGITLMERPEEVRAMVAEARRLTTLPLSAKIRIGSELDEGKLLSFCTMLEDEGVDMLTIHARLKQEPLDRRPRWECLAAVKERIRIPLIANGGIFSVEDAEKCLRISGADGLMLGRGAVTRPWLFAEIARRVYGSPCPAPVVSLPALYEEFIDLLTQSFRPEHWLGRLKQFTPYFTKNYPFGHHLAMVVRTCESVEEVRERAARFFASAGDGPRYATDSDSPKSPSRSLPIPS